MSEQDQIELNKYSQKELLIMLYHDVQQMSKKVETIKETQEKHEVRISLVESRVMMWGALFGIVGGGIVAGVVSLIK